MARNQKSQRRYGFADARPTRALPEVPGYVEIDPTGVGSRRFGADAPAVAAETAEQMLRFFEAHDAAAVLAKCGHQLLMEMTVGRAEPGPSGLEQVHVELLQAFALATGPGRKVPASPNSMVRLWQAAQTHLAAHLEHGASAPEPSAEAFLSGVMRMRTTAYRNVFGSDDAAEIIPALLAHADAASMAELGYRLSDFARALFALFNETGERLFAHVERSRALATGAGDEDLIGALTRSSPWARRMWRPMEARAYPDDLRGWAAFQLSEMLCVPLFTFERTDLVARFGERVAAALFSRALAFGALSDDDLRRAYLANPIWTRPFVALDADTLFLPMPGLVVSFAFAIVEDLIGADAKLKAAYSRARARYLEDDVERILRMALPSAQVHRGVEWTDPDTKVRYEHDVVAVLGMQVVVFEAKSGRLAAAARRGGVESLKRNFEELFVEPGRQASRLEALLATRRDDVRLTDRRGKAVRIGPSGPSVVHKFGASMELVAGVTSSRRLFRETGLLASDQEWAPVLTLGELRMIADRLDTEVSFLHYLTRRATADDVLDFLADEQDLLSLYLTNGFAVDAGALEGRKVMFVASDSPVRGRASPRGDRREFSTPGIALPPQWRAIGRKIYESKQRHAFDLLIAILNQHLSVLTGMAERIRRWRSGIGSRASETLTARMPVGKRTFAVAVHLAKAPAVAGEPWLEQSRLIAVQAAQTFGATDCAVFQIVRRSATPGFDEASFFRFRPGHRGQDDNSLR